jgi:farnesyl diphosphate synthase
MSAELSFDQWASELRTHFEEVASAALPQKQGRLETLYEAMRYAVLGGGKRVRALFVYAAGSLTGAPLSICDEAAIAVEFVHAYSLVHDDLPCMDNDVLRRGKPTCHVQFGYAEAMLSGDALQPEAFRRLTQLPIDPGQIVHLVGELALASGPQGMCGGQMIDLQSVGMKIDLATLRQMHRMKTGALIRACVRMGALCGNKDICSACLEDLTLYAERLGLAFQVVDDILDATADTSVLGKTAGKDEQANKPTYVTLLGLQKAKELAQGCAKDARECLERIEASGKVPAGATRPLAWMIDYVVDRDH